MKKSIPYILLAVALAANLSVWVFDPGVISRSLFGRFMDWRPAFERPVAPASEADIREAMARVSTERIERRVRDLSAWPSRAVGYPGNRAAYEYIRGEFERIGLKDIRTDTFTVAVPVDRGARVTVGATGEEVPLACLWPNHVRTPTLPAQGVTGPLIYGGKGAFADFNGKRVEGSIVLMDFDCDRNYVHPMMLGAKAVIFFDNGGVNRGQAELKTLPVPANVPRFWADAGEGERLKALAEAEASVTVTARMPWEGAQTWNVYGWIPGSDEAMPSRPGEKPRQWRDRVVVIEAYYDATSIAPGRAPGAEAASGVATLLEVAEALAVHRPKFSVLVLATSGHFNGLAGINDFVTRHARKSEHFRAKMRPEERIDFDMFVGLDLSSKDSRAALFCQGTFYSGWETGRTDFYRKNTLKYFAQRFAGYAEKLFPGEPAEARLMDALAPPSREWWNFMSAPLAFDMEAALYHGMTGVTFATPYDGRERVDTPVDTAGRVDFGNVASQARTVAGMLLEACQDPEFFPEAKYDFKDYATDLNGTVYLFDRKVNPFVPKRAVPGAVVAYGPADSRTGVRTMTATLTDSAGRFRLRSVRSPAHAWTRTVTLSAYRMDADGEVAMAPDLGEDGDRTYPLQVRMTADEMETMAVLFECRTLSLFEVFDSRTLFSLDTMTLLGPDDGPLRSYGTTHPGGSGTSDWSGGAVLAGSPARVSPAAVAFVPPGGRAKIFMSSGLSGIKYLLTNAPDALLLHPVPVDGVTDRVVARAKGTGYGADAGVIALPAYRGARDMWVLDDVRLKQLARYGVENRRVERLHQEARAALLSARGALERLEYDRFIAEARRAWGLEARAYPDVKATANDTVQGIVFYFALLLPFSFFAERLLFGFADVRRRILGAAGVFVAVFLVLKWAHPAFKLASTPYIIFLAFVILALACAVLALLTGKFNEVLRRLRSGGREMHRADVGRVSAMGAAVSLGISNLRKRPVRTGLTATTLVLLTFTALSFTSVVTSLRFYKMPRDNRPAYPGMLVRDRGWRGLQTSALQVLESAFGTEATVIPRSWRLPGVRSGRAYFDIEAEGERQQAGGEGAHASRRTYANGLLGLTWREPEITGADRCLSAGRWFRQGERDVCLLPDAMARLIGIGPGDVERAEVKLFGRMLRVVGILDSERMRGLKDLDDERLTPVDTVTEGDRMNEVQSADPEVLAQEPISAFVHLDPENVAVLPHQTVMDLGGSLQAIAVGRFQGGDFIPQVEAFMARVALTAFVGVGENVEVYSSIGSTSLKGVGNLIIPIAIAALIVLNTMMGSVYERFSEIGIYSSLGLAPSHVSALFLAEAGVFATVGAVMGYLVGQVAVMVLASFGKLGGLTLNYSSLSAVTSTLVVMGTVMLSALYPSRKAAAMAVPDVTRRWVFPPPDGDHWRFDFPFTVGGTEVAGAYAYLTEVFDSYGEGSAGAFLTDEVKFGAEEGGGGRGPEKAYSIEMMTWLAPYDLGISQRVRMEAAPTGQFGIYGVEVHIQRLSGDVASWQRINRGFLNTIRKHFLIWRTLPQEVKDEYIRKGQGTEAVQS
ncbi:MAG: FtsX-like permease family protein [Candidatus Latescibacteria bacterium]|nr:FtsX-like permease family protein [Candidatus Latescibacterota bacterium]